MKQALYAVVLTILSWLTAAANVTYTYDAAGHLTKVDFGNGSVISYTYDGAGNRITRSVVTSVMAQTMTFGPLSNQPYGTAPFALSATASSGLTVSFASTTSAVCMVTGSSVTLVSVGTCTVQATQPGNANYTAAPSVNQSFQVTMGTPTVSFTGAPPTAPYHGTFTVVAKTSASTTAAITATGACSITGVTVTISAPSGSCALTATWAADSNYLAASAMQSTMATKATPAITWATSSAIIYGTPLSGTQLDATATYNAASVGGTFAYTPAKGAVLTAGNQTLSATFTPTNTTDFAIASASVMLQVSQATPKITWAKPAAISYGTALSNTQLDATAAVPGSFVYSRSVGTVLMAGAQLLSVIFAPTDTIDYVTATDSVTITVTKAAPTLTWNTPSPIIYGTPLTSMQLNATASAPGSFVYSPAAGAIESGGSHKLSVTFTPTDTVDYPTVNASVTLQVNPATPMINWSAPTTIIYGTSLSGAQLDATATYNGVSVGGAFAYAPAKGTVLTAGTQTLSVTFTPNNTSNYVAPAGASVTLQVNPATPKITWAKPTAIIYGTALGSAQLNATASVPGTFAYSLLPGSILAAGAQTLSVTFSPTDTTNYTTATDSVTITVNKATSTTSISSINPSPAQIGQQVVVLFSVSASGLPTGAVTVTATTGESCTGTLSAGTGSCALTFTASGSPKLTASYAGDANFKSSTSVKLTELVQ